ncbi:MAG TPA: hypothetical protein DDW65_04100 [Firmicutes bacterium]|nr:hypothetical protein [Bacillota bacterium]
MSWNPEVEIAIRNLLVDYPEILKPKSGGSSRPERVTFPPKVTPIMDNREKIPEIRIGLAETIQRLYLRTGERFQIIDQNGKVRFIGKAQTVLLIRQRNSGIEILTRQGVSLFKSAGSVSLTYNNPAATSVLLEVQYQHGTFWAGREDRIYRGNFQFLPRDSGLTIVNQLNLEEYLYGVVPSEMESDWPPEALAAQAVAARTYAVSHHNAFTSRGFDLLATIASQVYQGVLAERNSTNKAVDATRGQILIFNDKPISAFYTGNSGGYTASSQDLWGDTLIPYLQAVPDRLLPTGSQIMSPEELAQWLILRPVTYSCNPKYSAPSHYRWTIWVSRTEIETHLRLADKVGAINSIVISERTKSGIVTKVTVNGVNGTFNLTGDAIRSKLGGLRSNMFIIEPKLAQNGLPEYFIFYGGGFGHGVGMDQSGAAGMAADGYKYDQILNHYYSGSELKQLY